MQKLIIQDIVQVNATTYAIRFSGTKQAITAMDVYLTKQSKQKAYWDSNAFHGNGGWIMRLDCLRRLSGHFVNTERALVIAERMAALRKINLLARRK